MSSLHDWSGVSSGGSKLAASADAPFAGASQDAGLFAVGSSPGAARPAPPAPIAEKSATLEMIQRAFMVRPPVHRACCSSVRATGNAGKWRIPATSAHIVDAQQVELRLPCRK
ncbi:hypothetical protein WME89_40700 [Sorangium sp. So ce321]|uniref:hypothetical protein n=1 Tax=Sorangium sp. So ce321 TaxID=3133300 RepID=UPI003F5FD731